MCTVYCCNWMTSCRKLDSVFFTKVAYHVVQEPACVNVVGLSRAVLLYCYGILHTNYVEPFLTQVGMQQVNRQ